MMEGLATVGDADFPQTATNISGCGWSNDRGDWSIDTLADGALPENLHPPLCAARDVLNKYNAVVVRTVNLGKRKQADVEGPEEDTADQMFNEGIDAAARGQQLPDGWAFGKQIKRFPVSEVFWTTSELAARRRASRSSVRRVRCWAWLWMIC
jgi:hypothetical protein